MSKAWWLAIGMMAACGETPADDDTDTDTDTADTDGGGDGGTLTGDASAILALDADLAAGEALYADNCALCHAVDGSGGTGPDIKSEDAADIVEAVLEGPGVMGSAEDLGFVDQDVADVAAYAASL
jgi:mono/diheme cytochrome c family protein